MEGRDYVLPKDVQDVFVDVCGHRILLGSRAKVSEKSAEDILREILEKEEVESGMWEKR